jgi:flagellar basal-body rod protein FlgF
VLSSQAGQFRLPPGEISIGADGALSVAGGTSQLSASSPFLPERSLRRKARIAMCRHAKVQRLLHKRQRASRRFEAANQDVIQGSLDLIMMQRQAETMQRADHLPHRIQQDRSRRYCRGSEGP